MPDQKLSEMKEVLSKYLERYKQKEDADGIHIEAMEFALDIIEKWEKLPTEKETIKSILIKFATKKYDTKGKTILCVFDSKQLKNVSEAIINELSISQN